jgi:tetratricopeptide (TPR) repeat protein
MAVGLFDYVIGSLPWIYRTFAFFGGFSGDKEEGIEELKLVVEKGKYNHDDATLLLIGVYQQEGKFQDALALLQRLSDRYPRNHLFKLETASILTSMGRKTRMHCFSYAPAAPAMVCRCGRAQV